MSTVKEEISINCTGPISCVAIKYGIPEPALRLLLSILAGYPIAAFYRCLVIDHPSKPLHHIFFALSGFLLCIFNYGIDTYHSLIAIWTTYVFIRVLHASPKKLIAVNFVFHMSYLLIGYYFTESNDYDILWTMPHCVLVLRMIGFVFDVADGRKEKDLLSKDQKETALEALPSLLELSGYAYFPCAFLVGPQFPFRRYKRFTDGEFKHITGSIEAGIKRMLVGFLYLAIRQVGSMKFPDSYFLTDEYRQENFFLRLIYLGLWGKLSLYKYISCWLLTEGTLMCIGISYAGKTADGKEDWFGCSNVKLVLLETGYTMQDYVLSFNVNTNHWVAQNIYKRLKFLNNRTISYASALLFLAVWHGFHSGYYMSFLMEYMIVTVEKQIESVYKKEVLSRHGNALETSIIYKCVKFIALKSYNIIYMGWCLTPFIFLSFSRWFGVFKAVNFFGFFFIAIWFVLYKLYKYAQHSSEMKRKAATFSNATTLSPTSEENRFKND